MNTSTNLLEAVQCSYIPARQHRCCLAGAAGQRRVADTGSLALQAAAGQGAPEIVRLLLDGAAQLLARLIATQAKGL